MREHVRAALEEARRGLDDLLANPESMAAIEAAGRLIADTFKAQGHAYSCGNGGSMCDAMHFAEELSGRFRRNRPALGALAMSDPAHMSCAANDFGYDAVFSRFVEAHGRRGDLLLAISTSGKSANVIAAAKIARERGMKVVALTGKPGSELGALSDVEIATPAGRFADRVQELHIKVIHILIELVERHLFAEEYR